MATVSGMGFSGIDHLGSIYESGLGYTFSNLFADDEQSRSFDQAAYNSALQYQYAQKYAENQPTWIKKGLEDAGINPLLYFGQSPSIQSPSLSPANSSGSLKTLSSGGSSSSGNPYMIASARQELQHQRAQTKAQEKLAEVYGAQAQRLKFIPITESDNGSTSFLGFGGSLGGTDTLLYDTESNKLIRPKDNSARSVLDHSDTTKKVLFDTQKFAPSNVNLDNYQQLYHIR